MSETEADQDLFDDGFNEQALAMTMTAFEEQWASSQAAPLFSTFDNGPNHTDFPSAPLPPLPVQAPSSRPQYHHQHQQKGQSQRESEVDSESAKLIADLKHKLYVQEHEKKDLERKLRDSQDVLKTKAKYLNLKRQVQARTPDPSTSTQNSKRVFPQAPPRPKSKIRKTAISPSQSLRSPTASSSEIANAMESIHLSSQNPSSATRQPSSMQSPTASTQHYTPSIKSEPLSVSDRRSIPPSVPSDRESRCALPPRPPSSAGGLDALKQTFDVFKETNKSRSAKLNMILVPEQIREFARFFCSKLMPADSACSPNAKELLSLLVSDIQDIIIRSENPKFTIPSLLTQFGLCLPICIEEKLHDIISTIVAVLQRLATFSAITADHLVKEVKLNLTHSNVYRLISVLALYSFKKPPSMYYVVEEFPDIVHANSNDIILLGQKYSTMSREIAEALAYEKTPPQARNTVLCILSILSVVGAGHSKSTLSFLLTDMAFLNLLSVNTPLDILDKACAVLTLNMRDMDLLELDIDNFDNKPLFVVTQLCGLLLIEEPFEYYPHTRSSKQDGKNFSSQWYSLCKRVCNLLRLMAILKLPDSVALLNKKIILSEVIAFSMRCCEFDSTDKRTDHIHSRKTLVQSGCRALLTVVKSVKDANLLDKDTIVKLRNLVIFYVDKDDDSHPAKPPLLGIERWLDQLEK
ncbi:hypothetical protein MAM1_0386d10225 [Mucor ambiguus]|uniref:Uncharacterized protein n=1 Tax=Mucor ambiguus TaxID=91626 RepID=A0A0C9LY51_9FUNG|nr:hypothetical protein MAM1_0386d10225 [Mucor ambiguus]